MNAPQAEAAPPRSFFRRVIYPLAAFGGSAALVAAATLGLLWNTMFAQMPSLPTKDSLWTLHRPPAVEFQDAAGQTIAVRGPRYARAVKLAELPPHVVQAFIAAEDKRFYDHTGFDQTAILRALIENVRAGRTVQGGSTITQQLVKNLFLSPDQTLRRKLQEARLAFDLEQMLSKDEVLELYLNRIYLGASSYGLGAAARTYFNVDARDLSLAQAALIAGFPKAPSRFGQRTASPEAKARQAYVLDQMMEGGFITADQAESAKRQPLLLAEPPADLFAGHALDWAVDQARLLSPDAPPDLVITLTLDLDLQKKAQDIVTEQVRLLGPDRNASEAAAVIMDHSGAVRAMVGGLDYATSQFNRAVQARRQPGSSFKPFVYAAALEAGLKPTTIMYDEPVRIGDWRPRNYSEGYRGAMTLSEALAESVNTVAAQLGAEIGIENVIALARRFGIRSQLQPFPALALGTDEVTLIEITGAYGVFARRGIAASPYIIEEIRTSRGDLVYRQPNPEPVQVYRQDLADVMTGMLSRVVVQGTGRAARVEGWDVAGKTGTSQEWRDAWFIGYTSTLVGGVWVGNDNDTAMRKTTGGELPAILWSKLVTTALEGVEPVPLEGALEAEEFLSDSELARLTFYRRLSAALGMVAGRQFAGDKPQPNL